MSNGWDDFGEDVLLLGAASLPTLERSANPDVARTAYAVHEVGSVMLRIYLLIKVLSFCALVALIPYWFGVAAFLLEVHATGWLMLGGVFGLGIIVPFALLLARPLVKALIGIWILSMATVGIIVLASGYFATVH